MGWELSPGEGSGGCGEIDPVTMYLYGVLIILAVVIILGEWIGRRHHRERTDDQRRSDFRAYIAMAVLWPLFIITIIFIVLWSVMTRRTS